MNSIIDNLIAMGELTRIKWLLIITVCLLFIVNVNLCRIYYKK